MKNRKVQEVVQEAPAKNKSVFWNILPRKNKGKVSKTNKKEVGVDKNKIRIKYKTRYNSDKFSIEGLNKEIRETSDIIYENKTKIKKLESNSTAVYDFAIIFISVFSSLIVGMVFDQYLALGKSYLLIVDIVMAFIVAIIIVTFMFIIYFLCLLPFLLHKRGNNKKIREIIMETIELEIKQEVILEKEYSIIQLSIDYKQNNDKEVEK